jgi:hypothetical protein
LYDALRTVNEARAFEAGLSGLLREGVVARGEAAAEAEAVELVEPARPAYFHHASSPPINVSETTW